MIGRLRLLKNVVRTNRGVLIDRPFFASSKTIIDTIEKVLPVGIKQMKNCAASFRGDTIYNTGFNIWKWIRSNITYVRDDDNKQVIQLPSLLLESGRGDCKSMALFTASILSNLKIPYVFRYTNETGGNVPAHVYVVAYDGKKEIPIDAVYSLYSENEYAYKKDYNYNTMQVQAIAGFKRSGIRPVNGIKKSNYINSSSINGVLSRAIHGVSVADIGDQAAFRGIDAFAPGAGVALQLTGVTPSKLLDKISSAFGGGYTPAHYDIRKDKCGVKDTVTYWNLVEQHAKKVINGDCSWFTSYVRPIDAEWVNFYMTGVKGNKNPDPYYYKVQDACDQLAALYGDNWEVKLETGFDTYDKSKGGKGVGTWYNFWMDAIVKPWMDASDSGKLSLIDQWNTNWKVSPNPIAAGQVIPGTSIQTQTSGQLPGNSKASFAGFDNKTLLIGAGLLLAGIAAYSQMNKGGRSRKIGFA